MKWKWLVSDTEGTITHDLTGIAIKVDRFRRASTKK